MNYYYEERDSFSLWQNSELAYPAHLHGPVELVYMQEGRAHAFVDGEGYSLEKGDFLIVFPERVHYYDECFECRAAVVVIPLKDCEEFVDAFFSKSPTVPVVRGAEKKAAELLMFALSVEGENKQIIQKGLLQAVLGLLFEKIELYGDKNEKNNTIRRILSFCENNYKYDISVEQVAAELKLSRTYVSHIFSEKLHLGFRDYINLLRLGDAAMLIKKNQMNMTEIAFETGFETIRTFNRAFKKRYGISPLKYKKAWQMNSL